LGAAYQADTGPADRHDLRDAVEGAAWCIDATFAGDDDPASSS